MGHIFGINWLRYHQENQVDFDHINRMGYKSITLYEWMWGDRDFCRELLAAVSPDTFFIIRDHPLSEQKNDMYNDPVQTGIRHGKDWVQKWKEGRVFIPKDRCWVQGINEPDSNTAPKAIDRYTSALIQAAAAGGIRIAGWVFGTGHPSTVDLDPKGPIDWHWYEESAGLLKGFDGIASFHAYGSWNHYPWDNHLARMQTCPYALDCVIDEFGIDEGIIGVAGVGYRGHLTPEQYTIWLDQAQAGVRQRLAKSQLNLLSLEIFCYDTNSDWKLFDIREMRSELELAKWTIMAPPSNDGGTTIHIPWIPNDSTDSPTSEEPEPQPLPPDQAFERAFEFVVGVEGELSLDPNDSGNYWEGNLVGTKYGISGAVWGGRYDIPNLTLEQAKSIYYDHYWLASGADDLAWPLCLLHFDAAVQHGVGQAKWFMTDQPDPMAYMADRLDFYAGLQSFTLYGRGWIHRMASLLREMYGNQQEDNNG